MWCECGVSVVSGVSECRRLVTYVLQYTTLRSLSLEDNLMCVGRGERDFVLGMRNIFVEERETGT